MIWLCRVVIYSGCAVNTGFSISTPSLPLDTWTHVAFSHGGFPEVRFSAVHVVLIVVCICLCVRARARAGCGVCERRAVRECDVRRTAAEQHM